MKKVQIFNSGFLRLTQLRKNEDVNRVIGDIIIPLRSIKCFFFKRGRAHTIIGIDDVVYSDGWVVVEEDEETIIEYIDQVTNRGNSF